MSLLLTLGVVAGIVGMFFYNILKMIREDGFFNTIGAIAIVSYVISVSYTHLTLPTNREV